MPSFCVIDSCRRVKQPGDAISFHKFPIYNEQINQKWIEFVNKQSKNNCIKNISKYSSICSQHFKENDFNPSGNTTRKFLKRTAVPSLANTTLKDPVEIFDDQPMSYESCGLCRTQSVLHHLHPFDEYNFTLMRKCIPFINFNFNLMQKICVDCEAILNTFSSFIDKILMAQNLINQEMVLQQTETRPMGIKVEPLPEDDFINTNNFGISLPQIQRPPQKKLEILEIVDIKPMNFLPYETNALSCEVSETYEEPECQILSPPQLKVEIGEDGENEFEMIKKFMHISSVYLHDHTYVMENQINTNVKTEYDVQEIFQEDTIPNEFSDRQIIRFCCKKKFKSIRQYLLHKATKHKIIKNCKTCSKSINEVNLAHHKKYFCKRSKVEKHYKKIIEKIKLKKKEVIKSKKRKSHACPICKKLFKGPKNLYQHKLSHNESKYSCLICFKKFKRLHGLSQHFKAQHEKKKLHHCPVCNHPYALKGDIKRCKHSDLRKRKG